MPCRQPRNRRLADLLATLWGILAAATGGVAILEWTQDATEAQYPELLLVLRIIIVALMVVTAFLLVRYDLRRRGDD